MNNELFNCLSIWHQNEVLLGLMALEIRFVTFIMNLKSRLTGVRIVSQVFFKDLFFEYRMLLKDHISFTAVPVEY
jgi:hypothetical protein